MTLGARHSARDKSEPDRSVPPITDRAFVARRTKPTLSVSLTAPLSAEFPCDVTVRFTTLAQKAVSVQLEHVDAE